MNLLGIQFSLTDVLVLQLLAIALGFVIHFALVHRRRLRAMIEEAQLQTSLTGSGGRYDEPLQGRNEKKKTVPVNFSAFFLTTRPVKASAPAEVAVRPDMVQDLKQSLHRQQKALDQLLHRIDRMDAQESRGLAQTAAATLALEEREAELQKVKQQLSASQKVAGRVSEVYQEFDVLQQKLADLEESAGKAASLTLELDDLQQAYVQLKKEFNHKQDALYEAVEKASQLHQQLAETEDKLSEANLQRVQAQKRVQLLENMNAELHQVSDANKKLKSELRRIAELESMLSLVSDERDLLLKKRLS